MAAGVLRQAGGADAAVVADHILIARLARRIGEARLLVEARAGIAELAADVGADRIAGRRDEAARVVGRTRSCVADGPLVDRFALGIGGAGSLVEPFARPALAAAEEARLARDAEAAGVAGRAGS